MNITNSPKSWESRDRESWDNAAASLEADGYTRRHDSYWPAVFVKGGSEQVLVRDLGCLNWHPRERGTAWVA